MRRQLALANVKPRLRMTSLYYLANRYNGLVVGTGNKTELAIGYFTKYGDGGVDVLPLGDLDKTAVRGLAGALGVPEPVINKAPSAGLWEGQTDEEEIGVTYDELDRVLATFAGEEHGQAIDPDIEGPRLSPGRGIGAQAPSHSDVSPGRGRRYCKFKIRGGNWPRLVSIRSGALGCPSSVERFASSMRKP